MGWFGNIGAFRDFTHAKAYTLILRIRPTVTVKANAGQSAEAPTGLQTSRKGLAPPKISNFAET